MQQTHTQRIWDLVEWTRPRKEPVYHMLHHTDGLVAKTDEESCELFRKQFFPDNPRPIDLSKLDQIPQKPERSWPPFSHKELTDELKKTNNFTAPGTDHVPWRTWKQIIEFKPLLARVFANIFSALVTYKVFPKPLKEGLTVCIPKPDKDHTVAKGY